MTGQDIELELQHTPRMVKRRGTRGYGTLFCQWLLLPPLFALTLFMLLWSVHLAIVRVAGPVVPCRIVDQYTEYDKEESKTRYYLVYRYSLNGREYSSRQLIERNVYLQQSVNGAANAQVSPIWPGHDSLLLAPGVSVWENVWLLGGAAFVMSAGVAVMAWFVYALPIKRRRLALHGVPVRGRLTNKTSYVGSKSESYYFHYEYQPEGAASPLTGRQSVRRSDWDEPRIGENYTILYDPQNPQFSIIYQYGDYEVI